MDDILSLALRVNDFMSGLLLAVGIRLVDFKIEIGRVYEGDFQRLVIADEISPDSCRLWDIETGKPRLRLVIDPHATGGQTQADRVKQAQKKAKAAAKAEMKSAGPAGYGNVIWALLNTREFLFIQ